MAPLVPGAVDGQVRTERRGLTRDQRVAQYQAESAGILNRVIAAWARVQARGLSAPKAVREASREYQEESDQLGRWREERTVADPSAKTKLQDLWEDYRNWCHDSGDYPSARNNQALAQALRKDRFETRKMKDGVRVEGLALRAGTGGGY